MDRLTTVNGNNNIELVINESRVRIKDTDTLAVAKKLKEYEDMKEQDRLIKLPCKIGDTVYQLNVTAKNPIIPLRVVEYRFAIVGNHVREKICCSDDFLSKSPNIIKIYYAEDIGDKIFLTKEEAETIIKRLKGMDIEDIDRD